MSEPQRDNFWVLQEHLPFHLEHSLWTPVLERFLERFSLVDYLEGVDLNGAFEQAQDELAERFFDYLKDSVSLPSGQTASL